MDHYLRRHAEPEAAALTTLPGRWKHALVVPAYREPADCLNQFQSIGDDTLLILVLNRPDTDTDIGWAQDFRLALPESRWQHGHLSLHRGSALDVLLVDRCITGRPLPRRQGVGLARKIGADIAAALVARGAVAKRWIGSTDADATLPAGYWQALQEQPADVVACVYPFTHECGPGETEWPIRCYEFHQLHYVAGLRRAGSPYAWPTVGSCLAVHAEAYAKVRGFPRRDGGEDFYLLNKIAKVGGVRHLASPMLHLSARHSDRVPFGTGPALTKIATLSGPEHFRSYNPLSFDYLRLLLIALQTRAAGVALDTYRLTTDNNVCPETFRALWTAFDCERAIATAHNNSRSVGQALRHMMTWFDGFRTLKWLQHCRQ